MTLVIKETKNKRQQNDQKNLVDLKIQQNFLKTWKIKGGYSD